MAELPLAGRGEIRRLRDLPPPDAATARQLLGLLYGQTARETQHQGSTQAQSA